MCKLHRFTENVPNRCAILVLMCAAALFQFGCGVVSFSSGYNAHGQLLEEGSGNPIAQAPTRVSLGDARLEPRSAPLGPPKTDDAGFFRDFVPTEFAYSTIPIILAPLAVADLLPPPATLRPPPSPDSLTVIVTVDGQDHAIIVEVTEEMVTTEGVRLDVDLGVILVLPAP